MILLITTISICTSARDYWSITDPLIRREQAIPVIKLIMEASDIGTPQDLIFSLKLLCLPMAGSDRLREGISAVVTCCPQVAFEYGKQFCLQPTDWSVLLSELLASCTNKKDSNENMASSNEVNAAVYEQILEYLTGFYDPDAFLNLLPAEGHLLYFLPYIEKAFCRHRAKSVQHSIAQFMQDLEMEQPTL